MADKYTEKCVPFAELTLTELYEVLRLRHQVFVMEQKCFFMDADRNDQMAYHYMLFAEDGSLAGYTYSTQGPPNDGYYVITNSSDWPRLFSTSVSYTHLDVYKRQV